MTRFSLIGGAGYIAPRHVRAIREIGGDLHSVFDIAPSSAHFPFFPKASVFTSFADYQRFIHSHPADIITICSPNHLHQQHILWALEQGADVICEKPLVLDPAALDVLKKAEQLTGKRVYTVLQLRLLNEVQQLKMAVENSGRSDYEVDIVHITPRNEAYFASWKGQEQLSGGIITNIGIHLFDLLLWIFGPMQESRVRLLERTKAAGFLQLEKASVRWRLSVDPADLPMGSTDFYRRITVDEEELSLERELSQMHGRFYAQAIAGEAPGIEASRPSIELCRHLMAIE